MFRHAVLGMFVALIAVSAKAGRPDFTFVEGAPSGPFAESNRDVDGRIGHDGRIDTNAGGWDRDNGRDDWDRGGRGHDDRDRDETYPIRCESQGYRYTYCNVQDHVSDVRLTRQLSDTACIEGVTWGHDRGGVWVDRGCRAEFLAYTSRPEQENYLSCGSRQYKYNTCYASGRISRAHLVRQRSDARCDEGFSWGVTPDRRGIWVDRGCSGDFQLRVRN